MRNLSCGVLAGLFAGCAILLTGCKTPAAEFRNSPGGPTSSPDRSAERNSAKATAAANSAAAPTQAAPGTNTTLAAKTIVRIKAGLFQPFKDASGNMWLPDQGFEGGDTVSRDPDLAIANTKDPDLYRTEHYAMSSFSCKLPNGKYLVKLHFAETFEGITGPKQRVFSFNVQGHAFKDVDLWVKAGGPNRAYIETVPVEVTNAVFKIEFTSQVENPEINALEITPQG